MIVIVVETELYPILVIGLTENDIVTSDGILPIVDLIQTSEITGIPKPPGAVQVVIGGNETTILAAVQACMPDADFTMVAERGTPIGEAIENAKRAHIEHVVNTSPGRLN